MAMVYRIIEVQNKLGLSTRPGPGVKTRVDEVHVQKRMWFEVKLEGALENSEPEVIHDSNDDAAGAQRKLKVKQLE
ncbi:hypothetical protein Tco_0034245 [Tanacetum coccineum]